MAHDRATEIEARRIRMEQALAKRSENHAAEMKRQAKEKADKARSAAEKLFEGEIISQIRKSNTDGNPILQTSIFDPDVEAALKELFREIGFMMGPVKREESQTYEDSSASFTVERLPSTPPPASDHHSMK